MRARAYQSPRRLARENARLEAQLRAQTAELVRSRGRLASAVDHERERIARDLHDGAQQRLVALRVRLSLVHEQAADTAECIAAALARVGEEVDTVIEEVRNLAHAIYPHELRDHGVRNAVASVTRGLPFEVAVRGSGRRRYPPDVETAVYFCCLEALQNVGKHCGAKASATVRFRDTIDGGLEFEVSDDGPGFEPTLTADGAGIAGMRHRLAGIGGELTVLSPPGMGTTVAGRVPAAHLTTRRNGANGPISRAR